MMHLVKLCVGVGSFAELESYRAERPHWWGADYGENVHVHRTRTMPRRAGEIVGQGSLYWVIAGMLCCRQPILRLVEATDRDGRPCCDILMAPDLVRVVPRPWRPFQGWRYLEPKDAPADLIARASEGEGGDAELAGELARLGLL